MHARWNQEECSSHTTVTVLLENAVQMWTYYMYKVNIIKKKSISS